MAAEKSKNTTASCSKTSGFSYANAVLNFKNECAVVIKTNEDKCKEERKKADEIDKSNKENVHDNENVNKHNVEEEKSDVFLNNLNSNNNDQGETEDDFIDYSGSKRKKKNAKIKNKEISSKLTPIVSKNVPVRQERIRPKRKEKITSAYCENNDPVATCDNIKYIEAPVPKVNPWTVNRNAASVIKGETCTTSNPLPAVLSKYKMLIPENLYF